jgi:hypothetical protein
MDRSLIGRLLPEVRCSRCGKPLFRGFANIAFGRVYLYGAERTSISVEWSSRRSLSFRHDNLDECVR